MVNQASDRVSSEHPLEVTARATSMAESVAGGLGLVTALLQAVGGDAGHAESGARAVRTMLAPVMPVLDTASEHSSSTECRSCPICRLLAIARVASPELVDGLGDALDAVVRALAEQVGTASEGSTWD